MRIVCSLGTALLLCLALLGALAPAAPAGVAPLDARNVELVAQIGGATYAVAVQENYAYIGVGHCLVTVDISTPAHPAVVGRSAVLPDIVQGVAVVGNLAYVADGPGGLRAVDVANPASPREVGFYDTPGDALGVYVVGRMAYVAAGSGGLRAVDVANPASARRLY